jgi:hypothetical protein
LIEPKANTKFALTSGEALGKSLSAIFESTDSCLISMFLKPQCITVRIDTFIPNLLVVVKVYYYKYSVSVANYIKKCNILCLQVNLFR